MEEWRPYLDTRYDVSSEGRVRNRITGRILKPQSNNVGYQQVYLGENLGKLVCVHRCIATAFLPNPDNHPEVDHIDRSKTNNVISNLRWVTRSMNNRNRSTNNVTGYVGVSVKGNGFQAKMSVNGQQVYLGYFKTPEEASAAYQAAVEAI